MSPLVSSKNYPIRSDFFHGPFDELREDALLTRSINIEISVLAHLNGTDLVTWISVPAIPEVS